MNTQTPKRQLTGMLGFAIIWVGQVFSLLGTSMTSFALSIWAWQITGQATTLALLNFFGFAPVIVMSPIAGALVDRYNRKKIMILADFAAGLPTIGVLLLYVTGNLQIWHLFITSAIAGTFQSFHFPAYSAAITMILPKKHYARAGGMLSLADFASLIFAPIIAALLLTIIGIEGIMLIDITSFCLAICMLLVVHIPQPPVTEAGLKGVGSIWKEAVYGFRYIYERPSLLGLQLIFFTSNFFSSFGTTLLTPMVLSRTQNDAVALGTVMSAAGVGGLVGSVILIIWGGPKRRINGVLLGIANAGFFGLLLMGLGRTPIFWTITSFIAMLSIPIANSSSQAIWQAKVAPDVQGRVFATRRLIAQTSAPMAMIIAGPLADRVFEPGMMTGGNLTALFGWVVGTGPGTGIAAMFVIAGILEIIFSLGGYAVKAVRDVEDILPDHDVKAAPA